MITKPYLVHEAYTSLLRKAEEFEEKDWDTATKYERHAIHAALDIRDLAERIRVLEEALREEMQHLREWHPEHCKAEDGVGGCAAEWIAKVEKLVGALGESRAAGKDAKA